MDNLADRSILQLFVTILLLPASVQQVFFEQQLNQLPAPDLGGHDVLPEMFLTALKKSGGDLNTGSDMPPDTLVDPDGRIVAFSRRWEQKHVKELQGKKQLLEEIAEKNGKKIVSLNTYLWTVLGCICIVACGIVPAFVLPYDSRKFLQSNYGRRSLHLLLSFAVGSLIGDVFLHLLPAVWADAQVDRLTAGVWTTAGVSFCFVLEKLCSTSESSQRRMCAILNLIANFMDNFTHGLAIGGSFLTDPKLGLLTTFSIVIHELPHEISDFAILLRANFSRWSAIQAQLLTAVGGAVGACAALLLHSEYATNGASQSILPFTAGGFINIALAQILPELMKETDSSEYSAPSPVQSSSYHAKCASCPDGKCRVVRCRMFAEAEMQVPRYRCTESSGSHLLSSKLISCCHYGCKESISLPVEFVQRRTAVKWTECDGKTPLIGYMRKVTLSMSMTRERFCSTPHTFRPKKKFPVGTLRYNLHKQAQATLHSGLDLKRAVRLPPNENFEDWLAVHTVDFFNRINLLYGIISDVCTAKSCPTMSGGPRYEYLWQDGISYKKPTRLPAPEYIFLLMDWIEIRINNETIFPSSTEVPFPRDFRQTCKKILTRLFRVFVHIYIHHFDRLSQLGAKEMTERLIISSGSRRIRVD
uniref:Uncharacterized protein n=1 Tax=Setaria digitata TaxID=48799 RepID=A0A915PKX0_9BILA